MSSFYDFGSNFNCSHFEFANYTFRERFYNICYFDDQIYAENSSSSIHPIVRFSLQLFYGLIFICGVSGNTLVIYVVANHSKMKTVTNLYILNLAIADLLYLIGLPFLIVTSHVGNWVFGNFMCKMYMVVTSLNQFTSSFFLSIMSADRYIAVCHPINAQKYRTTVISKILSLSAWACSSLMIFPVFLYSRTFEVENQIKCNIFWSNTSQFDEQRLFTIYSVILSFVFPLILIFVFYGLVIQKLRRIKASSSVSGRKRSQRKVTRLVLTLIIVYAVCYFPYWALQISLFFLPPRQSHPSFVIFLFLFSSCLSYSNSAVNPILYAFLSDNFKKSFKRIIFCKCKEEDLNKYRKTSKEKLSKQKFSASKEVETFSKEHPGPAKKGVSWEENNLTQMTSCRKSSFRASVGNVLKFKFSSEPHHSCESPNNDTKISSENISNKTEQIMYKITPL